MISRLGLIRFRFVMKGMIALFIGLFGAGMLVPAGVQAGCPLPEGKTVRWVVPYSAGGGFDAYSRMLTPFLAKRLGAKIRVDNVSGSGGLIGAKTIMQAPPDGLTMGLINTTGIMASKVSGVGGLPNPAEDYTFLGRLAVGAELFVAKGDSEINSMDDVFKLAAKKPILYAVTDVGSSVFVNSAIIANMLGYRANYVAGYKGTRKTTLAVMRGEVDLAAVPFGTAYDRLKSGELKALMQLGKEPVDDHPILKDVPVLAGPDGLAASRARELGRNPAKAAADAEALVAMNLNKRMAVAPRGIEPALAKCLQDSFMSVLADPDFLALAKKANRPIQQADPEQSKAGVIMSMSKVGNFSSVVEEAIKEVRK